MHCALCEIMVQNRLGKCEITLPVLCTSVLSRKHLFLVRAQEFAPLSIPRRQAANDPWSLPSRSSWGHWGQSGHHSRLGSTRQSSVCVLSWVSKTPQTPLAGLHFNQLKFFAHCKSPWSHMHLTPCSDLFSVALTKHLFQRSQKHWSNYTTTIIWKAFHPWEAGPVLLVWLWWSKAFNRWLHITRQGTGMNGSGSAQCTLGCARVFYRRRSSNVRFACLIQTEVWLCFQIPLTKSSQCVGGI